jgi:EAL domain-containing protein (putative c-di-GMP-specific phosphodiesterase class I)
MSNDLRDALKNDDLALHYQPVVELATGRVVGVEALARWHHPVRGHVSPGTFVEVAEGTGMALALGRWAVDRARRDVGRLQPARGRPLRIAMNIPARHLADPDLEDIVLEALHAGGLGPGELVLEITESAIMENPEQARALLQRLQAPGVETAIDDFGSTGYSSLGYLHRLPVTTLKIDRSFIKGITVDPDALAITSSIIELARAMGLTTVAEGVETPEQLTVLRRLGCTAAQGFLWSPAVLPEALAEKLDALPGRRFDVSLADAVG